MRVSGTVHKWKNSESQIMDIKISFSPITKISKYGTVFTTISYAREGRCEESKNCKRLRKGSILKITYKEIVFYRDKIVHHFSFKFEFSLTLICLYIHDHL